MFAPHSDGIKLIPRSFTQCFITCALPWRCQAAQRTEGGHAVAMLGKQRFTQCMYVRCSSMKKITKYYY